MQKFPNLILNFFHIMFFFQEKYWKTNSKAMGYFIMECNFMSGTEIAKYSHAWGLMKLKPDPSIKIFRETSASSSKVRSP